MTDRGPAGWRSVGADLVAATAFLTVVGRGAGLRARAPGWFPAVGLGLGAGLGALWWWAGRLWPPLVVGALVTAADAVVTGLLHLDGLVDTADGLLPHLERDRRLQVMREPTVGAFGVAAVVVVVLLRWAALSAPLAAGPAGAVLLLAGLWALARTVMAGALSVVPSARSDGLARSMAPPARWAGACTATGAATSAAALIGWRPEAGAVVWVAAATAGVVVVVAGRRRLGGITGDVLGAAGVIVETVGLLVAAARW